MHRPFDRASAGLACAGCGRKLPLTIGKARRSPTVTCDGCGVKMQIDAVQLDRTLTELDRRIARFPKEIRIEL